MPKETYAPGLRGVDAGVLARSVRKSMTPAERALWMELRRAPLDDSHFRRQTPIGPFIVDFACRAARLVVEVDGNAHDNDAARESDAQRDGWLREGGYRVLRFTNAEVLSDLRRVARIIVAETQARIPRRPTP
ncbi:MAG: endonuclease domain-containing protein [Caulobacteraceae bacterium]